MARADRPRRGRPRTASCFSDTQEANDIILFVEKAGASPYYLWCHLEEKEASKDRLVSPSVP